MKKVFQFIVTPALAVLCLLERSAFAQWRGYEWGHGPGMMHWGYGMGWVGTVIMAAFWIAVILGIIFLIRWLTISIRAGSHGSTAEDSALEILKKRYARGEIDKQEFDEKKKDLI
ncbi:MAG TPA: SHOCT domain-containing protein [Desulfatiglandales bacterium]|nr:SHOCT domain-containing protein [Desulfatiglandales bacterium]